jgi:hypothetical protein
MVRIAFSRYTTKVSPRHRVSTHAARVNPGGHSGWRGHGSTVFASTTLLPQASLGRPAKFHLSRLEQARRATDDASCRKDSPRRALPARLGRDGRRRVRVGAVVQHRRTLERYGGFSSLESCDAAITTAVSGLPPREVVRKEGFSSYIRGGQLERNPCLPDTIDPRGPKAR